ncbi:MAG: transposase [Elainella sp. C42_A2020_010]|nr:transposase [Elainella sp. C42_A2020_010]
MTSSYPSNLTQEQWELLESLIPPAKPGGRPRSVDLQAVVNAILYILCAGCAWRMLPSDFPAWKTVYHYFRAWRIDGTWERINHKLHQWVRVSEDRDASPQVKGRKRHLLVDTLGLVLMVVVTAASVPERQGAKLVFAKLNAVRHQVHRLWVIWTDGGYDGRDFIRWVMDTYRWIVEPVRRKDNIKGFVPVPQRWKVERTFGWFNWCRRLSKDYEILPQTSEAFIYIANIRIMLRRLA